MKIISFTIFTVVSIVLNLTWMLSFQKKTWLFDHIDKTITSIKVMIKKMQCVFFYLTGSRRSSVMTSWRSTMGQTSCLLLLAPLMVPRCPSSCSAAAIFFICCLPQITADQTLASEYYMKVSQKQISLLLLIHLRIWLYRYRMIKMNI